MNRVKATISGDRLKAQDATPERLHRCGGARDGIQGAPKPAMAMMATVLAMAFLGLWPESDRALAQWAPPKRVSVPDSSLAGRTRVTGNGESDSPRYSRDGRFVVFASGASDLTTNDVNGFRRDVFLRELATGRTTLVSVNTNGRSGNGDSFGPDISADGRFVAFASRASDLVPGDANGVADVFVRDRVEERTIRVSVATDGTEADKESHAPRLTADGTVVLFGSRATNLDASRPDTDGRVDVFLRNLMTKTTSLVTQEAREGTGTAYDIDDYDVSDDGRWVAFTTTSTNVVLGAPRRMPLGVYVRDVARGTTQQLETTLGPANLARATAEVRSMAFAPGRARLALGTWVAISTTNGSNVVEVVDLTESAATFVGGATGWGGMLLDEPTALSFDASGEVLAFTQSLMPSQPAVLRVWRSATGVMTPTNLTTGLPVRAREVAVSPTGTQVVFTSPATNLVATGTPLGEYQLYRMELESGQVTLLSTNTAGTPAGGLEFARPSFGAEGKVVFQSASDTWIADDQNRAADVFERDLESGESRVISVRARNGSGSSGGGDLLWPGGVSADGRRVLFASLSDDLVPNDAKGQVDLFVRDVVDGRTLLVTVPGAEGGPSRPGFVEAVLSANGRHVAFIADLLLTRADGTLAWTPQVFVRDLALETTRTVALNPDGQPASIRTVSQVQISADGRYIAFFTDAMTLVEGSTTRGQAILRDMVTEKTWLVGTRETGSLTVSLAGLGGRALAVRIGSSPLQASVWDPVSGRRDTLEEVNGTSALLSYDGSRVVFTVAGDGGTTPARIRWRDDGAAQIREVALPPEAQGTNVLETLSRDGRWAAVRSKNADGGWTTWAVSLESGSASRVDVLPNGSVTWATTSRYPSLSADGRWMTFETASAELVSGDLNGVGDVFARDLATLQTRRVDRTPDGLWETDIATRPTLSADGGRLFFMSRSAAFATEDDNGGGDVFAVDLEPGPAQDEDGDGLDDRWERTWFGNRSRDANSDDDGDGAIARDEFRAKTSPLDDRQVPAAATELRLSLIAEANGTWAITWRSEAGRRYHVQANEVVSRGGWINVGEAIVGDGGNMRVALPVTVPGERFFRVAVEP